MPRGPVWAWFYWLGTLPTPSKPTGPALRSLHSELKQHQNRGRQENQGREDMSYLHKSALEGISKYLKAKTFYTPWKQTKPGPNQSRIYLCSALWDLNVRSRYRLWGVFFSLEETRVSIQNQHKNSITTILQKNPTTTTIPKKKKKKNCLFHEDRQNQDVGTFKNNGKI